LNVSIVLAVSLLAAVSAVALLRSLSGNDSSYANRETCDPGKAKNNSLRARYQGGFITIVAIASLDRLYARSIWEMSYPLSLAVRFVDNGHAKLQKCIAVPLRKMLAFRELVGFN